MTEVLIYSQNEVYYNGVYIYYHKLRSKWVATANLNHIRFYIEDCQTADEAIKRIQQAMDEYVAEKTKDKRTGQGRRAYDKNENTFGKGIHGLWDNLGRRSTDTWD